MLQKSSSTFIDVIVTNDILSENKNLECIRMCFLYIVIFGFFFLQQSSVLCLCSLYYHYCFLKLSSNYVNFECNTFNGIVRFRH